MVEVTTGVDRHHFCGRRNSYPQRVVYANRIDDRSAQEEETAGDEQEAESTDDRIAGDHERETEEGTAETEDSRGETKDCSNCSDDDTDKRDRPRRMSVGREDAFDQPAHSARRPGS